MQITICNKKVICRGIGFFKLPFNNDNNSIERILLWVQKSSSVKLIQTQSLLRKMSGAQWGKNSTIVNKPHRVKATFKKVL